MAQPSGRSLQPSVGLRSTTLGVGYYLQSEKSGNSFRRYGL